MITFDGIIFSLRSRVGGVSVYLRELFLRGLDAHADVGLIVHSTNAVQSFPEAARKHISVRPLRFQERYRRVSNLPPGILHTSYYRSTAQRGVRNVLTVYDFTYERYFSGLSALVHGYQKRAALARADAVICISENTRRDLAAFVPGYDMSKVFVTHLAASAAFAPPATSPVNGQRPFVLFVGGRVGYKNFAAAVRAVARAREPDLAVVGSEAFTTAELELLERELPGRYRHEGTVSTAALNDLYHRAVCLIYPSLYEGFGIPPLEAMQAGCPFIALRHSSIPEVAGDAGILLAESDVEAMSAAISACADPRRREELRSAGFARARGFSWQKTFDETAAIYRALGR
jgi:mannosyltransferase